MYTVGPQTANSTPCHFEQQCFFVISSEAEKSAFCHCQRSNAPLVISSGARSAKPRNLPSRPASCHFERSREICHPVQPLCHFERSTASCHPKRSTASCHFERSTASCHFERSTKCEVEKSAQKLRLQRRTYPAKKNLSQTGSPLPDSNSSPRRCYGCVGFFTSGAADGCCSFVGNCNACNARLCCTSKYNRIARPTPCSIYSTSTKSIST